MRHKMLIAFVVQHCGRPYAPHPLLQICSVLQLQPAEAAAKEAALQQLPLAAAAATTRPSQFVQHISHLPCRSTLMRNGLAQQGPKKNDAAAAAKRD